MSHYNITHNLLTEGLMSSKPTASALQTLRGKRSLVISRSTFPGSGAYAGHTSGKGLHDLCNYGDSIFP